MLISEAVKEALEAGLYITRRGNVIASGRGRVGVLKPIHCRDICEEMSFDCESKKQKYRGYWKPTADDLMADDWEVVSIDVHGQQ